MNIIIQLITLFSLVNFCIFLNAEYIIVRNPIDIQNLQQINPTLVENIEIKPVCIDDMNRDGRDECVFIQVLKIPLKNYVDWMNHPIHSNNDKAADELLLESYLALLSQEEMDFGHLGDLENKLNEISDFDNKSLMHYLTAQQIGYANRILIEDPKMLFFRELSNQNELDNSLLPNKHKTRVFLLVTLPKEALVVFEDHFRQLMNRLYNAPQFFKGIKFIKGTCSQGLTYIPNFCKQPDSYLIPYTVHNQTGEICSDILCGKKWHKGCNRCFFYQSVPFPFERHLKISHSWPRRLDFAKADFITKTLHKYPILLDALTLLWIYKYQYRVNINHVIVFFVFLWVVKD